MLGHGGGGGAGGTHSKNIYKTLNETSNERSQQFFENQPSMRVTLNPFVGFGKRVFDRQLYTDIFKKKKKKKKLLTY